MDPVTILLKAVDQTGQIVAGVRADQFTDPTPCVDWDVQALLNHAIGVVEMFDDAAQAKPFNAGIFGKDNLGSDPAASYEQRAAVLRATLAQPSVLDGTWTMPFGEVPGPVGASFATLELFAHGWDVARACAQPFAFDPAVTEAANATAQMMTPDVRVPGVFGAESRCSADASAEDRLAAFLGRTV